MKRQMGSLITITLVVVVTIFVFPPILRILSLNPPTWSSQPNDAVTPEQASASNSDTSRAITLLAVTENQNGFGLLAHPVDPATLADLPNYAPINFGHHYTYAASPDRKTLAMITWPNGSNNAGGTLHLVDLDAWTDTSTDVGLDDYVSALTFSADGKRLYWTKPTVRDPAHEMPRDYRLYQYDLDSRQLSTISQFPSSFMPWSQRLSSGKIFIFSVPTDANNLAEDVPHVLIIDPEKNRIAADVRLDGVKAGQFYVQTTNVTPTAQGESGQYVIYNPGLAWDLERGLLYVLHPDEDKVTVVDLAKGAIIEQTPVRSSQSFLEWISDLLAPRAEAKGGPEITKRAELSPDGKRIYVLSQDSEAGLPKKANLRVIATDGMHEISHLDELLTDFALAPDGESLLVVKGETVSSYGFDMIVGHDVYVLDAETLQERVHISVDYADQLSFAGFSPDGGYAYLSGASAQWVEGSGWRDWQTTWLLLDLNSHRITPKVEIGSSYAVLLPIAP